MNKIYTVTSLYEPKEEMLYPALRLKELAKAFIKEGCGKIEVEELDKNAQYIYDYNNKGSFRSRTWGWYPKLSQAKEAAEKNVGEMCECGWYNYLVIEEFNAGIYALNMGPAADEKVRWFYKWNEEQDKWVEMEEEPKFAKGVVNYGMG